MTPSQTILDVVRSGKIGDNTELEIRLGRKHTEIRRVNGTDKRFDSFDTNIGHRKFSQYLDHLNRSDRYKLHQRVRSEIFNYDSGIRKEVFLPAENISMDQIIFELSGNEGSIRNEIFQGEREEIMEKVTVRKGELYLDLHDIRISHSKEIPVTQIRGRISSKRVKYRITFVDVNLNHHIDLTVSFLIQKDRKDVGKTEYQLELEYTDPRKQDIYTDVLVLLQLLNPTVDSIRYTVNRVNPIQPFRRTLSLPDSLDPVSPDVIWDNVNPHKLITTADNIFFGVLEKQEYYTIYKTMMSMLQYHYHDEVTKIGVYPGGLGLITSMLSQALSVTCYEEGENKCGVLEHNQHTLRGQRMQIRCGQVARYLPEEEVIFINMPDNDSISDIGGIPVAEFMSHVSPQTKAIFIKTTAKSKFPFKQINPKHFTIKHIPQGTRNKLFLSILIPRMVKYTNDYYIVDGHNTLTGSFLPKNRNYVNGYGFPYSRGEYIQKVFSKPIDIPRLDGKLQFPTSLFSVTDKLDGIGCRLMIFAGSAYAINGRGIQHVFEGVNRYYDRTVVEGELMSVLNTDGIRGPKDDEKDDGFVFSYKDKRNEKMQFYAYDMLVDRGRNIMSNTLIERLSYLNKSGVVGGFW
jgi:hypothetical protein